MKAIVWNQLSILYKSCDSKKFELNINNYKEKPIGSWVWRQFGKVNFHAIKPNFRSR